MKKTLCILLALISAVCLAGCSGSSGSTTLATSASAASAKKVYGQGTRDEIMNEIGVTDTAGKTSMVYKMDELEYTLYYVITFDEYGYPIQRLEYYFYYDDSHDVYNYRLTDNSSDPNNDIDYYKRYGTIVGTNDSAYVVVVRSKNFAGKWDVCEKRYSAFIVE